MNFRVLGSFLFSILLSAQLFADSSGIFLRHLEKDFFYNYETQRFGIEIEYKGVSLERSANIAQSIVGGEIVRSQTHEGMDLIILKNSRIGDLKIKVETNQTGESATPRSEWVYEIVGPPLSFAENVQLQRILDALKRAGAIGSEKGHPVSIQTNTESRFKNSTTKDADIEFEFLVMRNFYVNFDLIMRELSPIDSRLKYIQGPSEGMLRRMLDPEYKPTAKRMLDDYIYRQSLELMGDTHAWTLHISEVKKRILKLDYPIVKKVVKLNAYRFSSILIHKFPNDPYLKKYIEKTWTFSAPITEQRARNNDFDIISAMKQIVGLRNASLRYGLFKYNERSQEFETVTQLRLSCRSMFSHH